jgi:tRNA(Ser,Leu) C12 N-acetylase TAN1
LDEYNLLITCSKGLEKRTASNIYFILKSDLNDQNCRIKISNYRGLVYAYTEIDLKYVFQFIRKKIRNDMWYIGKINRIIPLHKNVPLKENEIVETAVNLADNIGNNQSYKIEIKNREGKIDRLNLIEKIASKINRRVDLEKPDKTLRIEIFEDFCGLSLLDKSFNIKLN